MDELIKKYEKMLADNKIQREYGFVDEWHEGYSDGKKEMIELFIEDLKLLN